MPNTQNNMLPGTSQYSCTIMYGFFHVTDVCFTNFVIVINNKMFLIKGLLMVNINIHVLNYLYNLNLKVPDISFQPHSLFIYTIR